MLGAVEDIRFKSKDGVEIHGLLVKPPSFVAGRKYPTVLWIHGGPNGQDEHSLVLDGYQFEPQMFAAKGFVVLRVNYRGGSGRGIAFAKAIFADWGHKEVEDLLAGVDYLHRQGNRGPGPAGGGRLELRRHTDRLHHRERSPLQGRHQRCRQRGSDRDVRQR